MGTILPTLSVPNRRLSVKSSLRAIVVVDVAAAVAIIVDIVSVPSTEVMAAEIAEAIAGERVELVSCISEMMVVNIRFDSPLQQQMGLYL